MASYAKSFKEEAVRLSDDIGAKQAAAQLGISYWTLSDWRAARKARDSQAFVSGGLRRLPTDEKERRILELEKEIFELKRVNEILKEALVFFRREPKEVAVQLRYAYIERQAKRWDVHAQCSVLDVSESGYYRYLRRRNKPSRDALLSAAIEKILEEHPQNDNYGTPRMQLALAQRGVKAGLRRVKRIMREHGWLHERRRRPKGLTRVDLAAMAAQNLLKQDFRADRPFTKLLTDITQVQCRDGKLYISSIMDCFNGEILSLCMRDNMKKELCVDTVRAMADRFPVREAILHNDRGSQYTSEAFRSELSRQGLTQSLSSVAHCYDNARMESFFATLKKELIYRISAYRLRMAEVKSLVFRYVFVYYNRFRVCTANPGGWPPETRRRMSLNQVA